MRIFLIFLCFAAAKYEKLKGKGWKTNKICKTPLYFTQGLEILEDSQDDKIFILSAGSYDQSKVVALRYVQQEGEDQDFLTECKFEEIAATQMGGQYFAEGMTRISNSEIRTNSEKKNLPLYAQLTWNEKKVFEWTYDNEQKKFTQEKEKSLPAHASFREGWGLAAGGFCLENIDGQPCIYGEEEHFFATNGTNVIHILQTDNFDTFHEIQVTDQKGQKLHNLNELEIIKPKIKENETAEETKNRLEMRNSLTRFIFANIFMQNQVHLIDLWTGKSIQEWDLTAFARHQASYQEDQVKKIRKQLGQSQAYKIADAVKIGQQTQNFKNSDQIVDRFLHYQFYDWWNNVPNGIAYDQSDDTFWITGKMWDFAFNVQLDYQEVIDKYVQAEQQNVKTEL